MIALLSLMEVATPSTRYVTGMHSLAAVSRLGAAPRMAASDEERKKKLSQLFGDNFKDDVAKELARVTTVKQPDIPERPPDWMLTRSTKEPSWIAERFTLWLEDKGVDLEQIYIARADEGQLSVVTAKPITAGDTLFEIPDELLLTERAAFADPDVGRPVRDMVAKTGGRKADGFNTFAVAALLAAERVRRGAVRGELKRQDGGVLGGGAVLPNWAVEGRGTAQSNLEFSPFVGTLDWPEDDECMVDTPERAVTIERGSSLIAQMIEPCARNAWMKATQRKGLAQATSDEDCTCTAMQALVLAMELLSDPPPPLGQPDGVPRWGGAQAHAGPALCPLLNLVVAPQSVLQAASDSGTLDTLVNAIVGRMGNVGSAVRCVATRDLPTGSVVVTAAPGAAAVGAGSEFVPGDRVARSLDGGIGTVVSVRPSDGKVVVRLDTPVIVRGEEKQLAVVPPAKLKAHVDEGRGGADDGLRRTIM